ncbi:hypothetical protein [uncultured Selenomonas sp.]|uniref:hypothetical protein n=1 Tax=uncultured Selenomonas sp. TaxID=159275 RepID=UPI0025FA77DF|nr:hypothetical protein [uncultured Selenomonas sp.]
MISEQEYVITSFRKHFQRFQDKGIVVYGLGKNTEVLLDALRDEYHFIGLMDGVRTGETVYGLPVLTVDEAQERGVGVILILARAANLSIIYPRIAADCERYGIPVYDINGVEQHRITQKTYACPVFYATHTREALIEKMRAADVVSFDVFDTLLMRRCLEPTDVFFLVEQEAHRRGLLSQSVPFAKPRILAERALYPGQPTLDDIYARLMQDTGIAEDVAKELRALGLAEEERQLVPRTAMMRLLHEAQAMGKTVIVTSDMYLGGQAIGRLLLMHGITGLDHVFVSSDTGVSKTGGLFDLVRQTYLGQHILHIGDNATSDVHAALSSGSDAWLVPSARQMLAESACAPLTEHSRDLPERVILGNFLTRELHDPFLFQKTQGRLRLADAYALGRDYAGPMVAGFVQWLIERCRADGIEMLLLGARDGWLIREILDDAARTMDLPFRYRYVYVSRAAFISQKTTSGQWKMERARSTISAATSPSSCAAAQRSARTICTTWRAKASAPGRSLASLTSSRPARASFGSKKSSASPCRATTSCASKNRTRKISPSRHTTRARKSSTRQQNATSPSAKTACTSCPRRGAAKKSATSSLSSKASATPQTTSSKSPIAQNSPTNS